MQLQIISRLIERSFWKVRVIPTLTGLAIGVLLAAVPALRGPAYAQNVAKPGGPSYLMMLMPVHREDQESIM